jgi:hypothetical protein
MLLYIIMSGYEQNVNKSSLGGGRPGEYKSGFGNTMTGGHVALTRRKLRKAFKSNDVKNTRTNTMTGIKATCGPFRNAYNLGDPLSRQNMKCGGSNQVNDVNSNVLNHRKSDSVSNQDCGKMVLGYTPMEVPLKGGNTKYVSDSSMFTEFKHMEAVNLTYNDKSAGGDQHNASFSFINSVRRR